jgi:hypothetical protein
VKKILTAISFVLIANISFAADKPVWVEAVGEAYMGEIESPKEVKERARKDAQIKALERAVGVFIRSHTLVSNSQLTEDLTYAAVRGKVEKFDIIHEGWDMADRNIYRAKINALVSPVYPEKGEGISLKLSLSKTHLKEGENVKLFYQSSSDCYIYVFSVAADGSVTVLLPNSMNRDNHMTAGRAYEFPPKGSELKLTAMFLPGYKHKTAEETIKIIATKNKEDLMPLGFQEGFFKVYDSKSTSLIGILTQRLNQLEPSEWTQATGVYRLER